MKTIYWLFAILGIVALLSGCDSMLPNPEQDVGGAMQTEEGVVTETTYSPDYNGSGTGVGITTNGDLAIHSTNVHIPAKWVVVIKCQHGKFILDSEHNDLAQGVWEHVVPGTKVSINFYAIEHVVIDRKTKTELSRSFVKYKTTSIIPVQ